MMKFGLFGLCILLGNHFGSTFGMAVAICIFMILSGVLDAYQKRTPKK